MMRAGTLFFLFFACSLAGSVAAQVSELDGGRLWRLMNDQGMEVRLACYGARITSIQVPDRRGIMSDVVLGYDSEEAYRTAAKKPYFGATLGRYAGRIALGRFDVDGIEYVLSCNRAPHHLHGGVTGFDKIVWSAERFGRGVRFTHLSLDGDEGYPGNLTVNVTYTLSDKNELTIAYRATADRPTPVNLSNHTYFNLAGEGDRTVLDHELTIFADAMTPIDRTSIPTGKIVPVAGTPFDFRRAKPVGKDIEQQGEQLAYGSGYDHNFVLRKKPVGAMVLAASLYEPRSGRLLEVLTEEPGLQLYSGNFLDGSLIGKSGRPYGRRSALCLETQHFSDSPNHHEFPNTILRPGEVYSTRTTYCFSTR